MKTKAKRMQFPKQVVHVPKGATGTIHVPKGAMVVMPEGGSGGKAKPEVKGRTCRTCVRYNADLEFCQLLGIGSEPQETCFRHMHCFWRE